MADLEPTRTVYEESAASFVDAIGTAISTEVEHATDIERLREFARRCPPGAGPVLDAGCGPGRAGALVAAQGHRVVGVDLAHAMVTGAAHAHPELGLAQASITALPLRTGSCAGVVAWYSVIHLPPDVVAPVWDEFRRVLAPGAPLLVAFQAGGGEVTHRDDAHGSGAALTSVRHDPTRVAGGLTSAGFSVDEVAIRPPTQAFEADPQAFVCATAP